MSQQVHMTLRLLELLRDSDPLTVEQAIADEDLPFERETVRQALNAMVQDGWATVRVGGNLNRTKLYSPGPKFRGDA